MIVTYQPEDILKDVEKYLDGGMDNLGFVPAYVFQTADYMAEDAARLEKLFNDDKLLRVSLLDYRRFVDAEKTFRGHRVLKEQELWAHLEKTFGEDTPKVLSGMNIIKDTPEGKRFYRWATGLHSLDHDIAIAAHCASDFWGRDIIVAYNTNDVVPELECRNFYHESAHVLQTKYDLFVDRQVDFLRRYRDMVRGAKYDKNDKQFARRWNKDWKYFQYKAETHAHTFGTAVMLAKTRTKEEFSHVADFVLEDAAGTLRSGMGSWRSACYNYWPMAEELVRSLSDETMRRRMLTADGRPDFKKICFYTAEIVNRQAYGKDEYWFYLTAEARLWGDKLKTEKNCRRIAEEFERSENYRMRFWRGNPQSINIWAAKNIRSGEDYNQVMENLHFKGTSKLAQRMNERLEPVREMVRKHWLDPAGDRQMQKLRRER